MKILRLLLLASFVTSLGAQTVPGKLRFALPEHAGKLELNQGNFKITEISAKPKGQEFGIRAEDGDLKFLGFLFLWPEKPHLTSASCRDEMLAAENNEQLASKPDLLNFKTPNNVDVAMALLLPVNDKFSMLRAFIAKDDLCADLSFTYTKPFTEKKISMEGVKAVLNTITFDPEAKPAFLDAFAYATVEWRHEELAGAVLGYTAALKLVDQSDDPTKWRRVTTDQLSMSLGMSGDLKGSKSANEAAIKVDPSYPMYYYDLACADAEAGDAGSAKIHLQEAFDRKANTLPGETIPDPTKDDSIMKLRNNREFWAFVQTINK